MLINSEDFPLRAAPTRTMKECKLGKGSTTQSDNFVSHTNEGGFNFNAREFANSIISMF